MKARLLTTTFSTFTVFIRSTSQDFTPYNITIANANSEQGAIPSHTSLYTSTLKLGFILLALFPSTEDTDGCNVA